MDAAGVLLDIDGVVVQSWEPLPGAVEAVAKLRDAEMPVRFVTNTTSRSSAEMLTLLRGLGIQMADSHLVTAGTATAELVLRDYGDALCYVLNDGSAADLAGLHTVDDDRGATADVVIVGSGGPSFSWDRINIALRALRAGAALVAMHGSTLWTTAEGPCLDCGAYASMLADAAQVQARVVGKPSPELFVSACAAMGVEPQSAIMVGDDVRSDVLAAQELGMTGVLVRTGKYHRADVEAAPGEPDHVIDSLAMLPDLMGLA